MAIEKYYNNKYNAIFDPIPSFEGCWLINNNNLVRNAKRENGKNLYEEFYKERIYKPLKNIIPYIDELVCEVGLISELNDNQFGRRIVPNKADFVKSLIYLLNNRVTRYGMDKEEFEAYIKKIVSAITSFETDKVFIAFHNAFKEEASRFEDVLKNEINSVYADAAVQEYERYKKIKNDNITFQQYVKKMYEVIRSFQNGLLNINDFFKTPLNGEEVYNAFEPEQFYLLMVSTILDNNLFFEKSEGELHQSLILAHDYFVNAKEMYKEDKKYNPSILFTWEYSKHGKREKVTSRGLHEVYKDLMARHKEINLIHLPDIDDDERYKDINLVRKLEALYNADTRLNWEFLPKGEKISKCPREKLDSDIKTSKKTITKEDVNQRIDILEASDYVGTPICGLNTFSGYYAYIYANGKVVLEKFWDDVENYKPALYSATYIMNIDNFIEMSKISKLSLIEIMKEFPNSGLKRIYHSNTNSWQKNLYEEITLSKKDKQSRIDEVIRFVETLKNGELKNEQ